MQNRVNSRKKSIEELYNELDDEIHISRLSSLETFKKMKNGKSILKNFANGKTFAFHEFEKANKELGKEKQQIDDTAAFKMVLDSLGVSKEEVDDIRPTEAITAYIFNVLSGIIGITSARSTILNISVAIMRLIAFFSLLYKNGMIEDEKMNEKIKSMINDNDGNSPIYSNKERESEKNTLSEDVKIARSIAAFLRMFFVAFFDDTRDNVLLIDVQSFKTTDVKGTKQVYGAEYKVLDKQGKTLNTLTFPLVNGSITYKANVASTTYSVRAYKELANSQSSFSETSVYNTLIENISKNYDSYLDIYDGEHNANARVEGTSFNHEDISRAFISFSKFISVEDNKIVNNYNRAISSFLNSFGKKYINAYKSYNNIERTNETITHSICNMSTINDAMIHFFDRFLQQADKKGEQNARVIEAIKGTTMKSLKNKDEIKFKVDTKKYLMIGSNINTEKKREAIKSERAKHFREVKRNQRQQQNQNQNTNESKGSRGSGIKME